MANEPQPTAADLASFQEAEENKRYLIFALGGELYGSPLTKIKEVLKLVDIKPVPYMKSYFRGVINLRGQILSVIDLREKFGLSKGVEAAGILLVVECDENQIAAIVDDVQSVATIEENSIDRDPILSTKIPLEFFLGVAKASERLINLIDIGGTVSSEDLAVIRRNKEAA